MTEEFERADRWQVGDGWGTYVDNDDGWWVEWPDYIKLLDAYNELKSRMDGLKK